MESCECLTCSLGRISKARHDQAEQDRLDAQRYRKLKAEMLRNPLYMGSAKRRGDFVFLEGQFDAGADALPEPEQKGGDPEKS
jgi:hypothetical protein